MKSNSNTLLLGGRKNLKNENIINLNKLIPEIYRQVTKDFLKDSYNEFVFKGGRGSLKSTIAGLYAVLNILDGRGSCVCIRRVKATLKDSCYKEILCAIERLGVESEFHITTSPLEIKHKKNGLCILFRGLDVPEKIKSLKDSKLQFTFLWFEECQEIEGYRKCRSVIQTVARGERHCNILYSFNPPESVTHWVNKELASKRGKEETRNILHTTYLDVPREWLGEQFFIIADELKESDYDAYRNEYLGEACGSKGMIFPNVRELTPNIEYDKSYVFRGNDFGFTRDPNAYVSWYYDKDRHILVLKSSSYKYGLRLEELAEIIKEENVYGFDVTCDCAEPRSIDTLYSLGVTALASKKGADSIRFGIKWLQSLAGIYIDKVKDHEVYKEFSEYEYPRDNNGEYVSIYPKDNNHSIDATRYALENVIRGYF